MSKRESFALARARKDADSMFGLEKELSGSEDGDYIAPSRHKKGDALYIFGENSVRAVLLSEAFGARNCSSLPAKDATKWLSSQKPEQVLELLRVAANLIAVSKDSLRVCTSDPDVYVRRDAKRVITKALSDLKKNLDLLAPPVIVDHTNVDYAQDYLPSGFRGLEADNGA